MNLFSDSFLLVLGSIWLASSVIGGAALAYLAKRIHKTISFKKNWLYFSVLLAVITGMVLGVAIR